MARQDPVGGPLYLSSETIEKKTLEGKISPDTLAQMIRADVTIPHLLSASITIGSVAEYYGSLQAVFDALGIGAKVSGIIQPESPTFTM